MNKHPTYNFEIKGYSSYEAQYNYNYLYRGDLVYINKYLEIHDSRKRLLGTITQKSVKENHLNLLFSHPNYFVGIVSSFSRSKSNYKVVNIDITIKDEYAYYFFKNFPNEEDKLFNFTNIFEKDSTVYTNYGPAKFIAAYKDRKTKYFTVNVPLIGIKNIYDVHSVEL